MHKILGETIIAKKKVFAFFYCQKKVKIKNLKQKSCKLLDEYEYSKKELLETLNENTEISDRLSNLFLQNLSVQPASINSEGSTSSKSSGEPELSEEYCLNFLETKINQFTQYKYLIILDNEKNSIIIGPNGSGKSSLANFFKKTENSGISVIPAGKYLLCENPTLDILKVNRFRIQQDMREADTKKDTSENDMFAPLSQYSPQYEFSRIIAAISNEFYTYLKSHERDEDRKKEYENNIFRKFTQIYNNLFPDITFSDPDVAEKNFNPIKNGNEYTIDQMSEGERVAIYYIVQVLLADDNGIIIVDEPDIYLNSAVYNQLWNMLEKEKSKCRFIYISHRIDFIESRNNANLIWCKGFTYPNKWDLKQINLEKDEFPSELLIELSGAQKTVIFCEGNKGSIDYKIYTALFPNCNIIPVGSCIDVVRTTKLYNRKKQIFSGTAYGVIDNDLRTEENICSLNSDKIFVTNYLEIEMLLCDEEVIEAVLKGAYPSKTENELQAEVSVFKNEFFSIMKEKKALVVKRWYKKRYEQLLYREKYDTNKDLKNNIKFLENDLEKIDSKSFENELDKILQKKEYSGLLKYCTLEHDEIVNGIGNKVAGGDYKNRAISNIIANSDLLDNLKKKYFSKLLEWMKS